MRRIAPIVAVVLAVAAAAAGIAIGAGGKDAETQISGPALARASAAALNHLGGGRVSDTEAGDEDGFYEVEVTLEDGSQVDVHLDRNFNVLRDEADGDVADGNEENDD